MIGRPSAVATGSPSPVLSGVLGSQARSRCCRNRRPTDGFGMARGDLLGLLRDRLRHLLCMAAAAAVWPALLRYALVALLIGRPRAFSAASERLARVPGLWGLYVRAAFYRRTLGHVGRDVHFGFMSVMSKPQARIGDGVYIGRFCTLGLVELGDDVMLADGVQVLSGRHTHGSCPQAGRAMRDNPHHYEPVCVGRGAWLCAGSVIMADVGADVLVAAGAVVVRPVPDGQRVAGIPARPMPTHQPNHAEAA